MHAEGRRMKIRTVFIKGWHQALREHYQICDEIAADETKSSCVLLRMPAGIRKGRRPLNQWDRAFGRETCQQHDKTECWIEVGKSLFHYRDPEESVERYEEWIKKQDSYEEARNATTKKRHQSPKKRKAPH